ncbi:unnamed protein product [Paramecium primaurelia]|uniref:Phospholipid-transporting ATPase n=1 Tax=Paramecium primaurelia TaxID=5886 RepID=A0A8S1KF48_PARPR|nr:unnamed protein product [Paramecium primaurelia]
MNNYFQINEQISQTEKIILPDDTPMKNKPNTITTMKTSWFTFLPYAFIKQITQPANIYFIVIGILQIIPATSYTNGVPTIYGPLAMMMSISILKDAIEEYSRYKSDQEENNRKSHKYYENQFIECNWKDIYQADIILVMENESIPCDILILSSNYQGGIAYVETKQIDGETNLKQKYSIYDLQQRYHIDNAINFKDKNNNVKFVYDQKNPILYKLTGTYQINNSQVDSLNYGNFIERGCILKNTEWIIGLCIYSGMNCKIMLNCSQERTKRSRLEQYMRICIISISISLALFCLMSSIYEFIWTNNHLNYSYLGLTKDNVFIDLGLWFSLLSYFIPISLVVNVELVKFGQAKMLESDKVMPNSKSHQSNLIEQLGEINIVFTDKTGTLTKNSMQFRELFAQNEKEALLCLSLCHSVVKSKNKLIGSSPDELAILEYCEQKGYLFQGIDNNNHLTINKTQFHRVMNFDFSSDKKRMTIVVKTGNEYVLFCKGADEVLLELIGECQHQQIIHQFAIQGYRTLMLGRKTFSQSQMEIYLTEYKKAQEDKDEEMMNKLQKKLEQNLEFLGITAVEDLLADDVGQTIQDLKIADIKVWVLTGDKVETAISIGYSCNLIDSKDMLQVVTQITVGSIEEVFLQYCNESANIALIISGQALTVMLDNPQLKSMLLKRAFYAKVVIVARVSPKQKQQVVTLVKENLPKAYTLAIGDGANDVSMINEAHVGVGIQGVEGTQAARAADFAISEFKHLKRLMFYYGVECSRRNALTILYIFFKNQVFITPYFWFGFLNGFSGQYLYDQWLSSLFNTVFAALPQVLYALFDEMHPSSEYLQWSKTSHNLLEEKPDVYVQFRQQPIFTIIKFWLWVFNGMVQGLIIFLVCTFSTENQNMDNGMTMEFFEDGVFIYGIVIILVNLKIFTFTYTNYNFTIFFIVLSILVYWLILIMVNDHELSPSFNFYRYLASPQLYLALALTCMLFLFDLAIERFYDFQIYIRKPESIELV